MQLLVVQPDVNLLIFIANKQKLKENLSPSDVSTISILNLSGVVLQKATALNTAHSFYVKQLPAGIYFIRIEENKKITTLKFIKSN